MLARHTALIHSAYCALVDCKNRKEFLLAMQFGGSVVVVADEIRSNLLRWMNIITRPVTDTKYG
jgi:hypothetical protein